MIPKHMYGITYFTSMYTYMEFYSYTLLNIGAI